MTDDTASDGSGSGEDASDPLGWSSPDDRTRRDDPEPIDEDLDRSRDDAGGFRSPDADGSRSTDADGSRSTDGDADDHSTDDRPIDDPTDAPLGDLASSIRNRPDRDDSPADEGLFEEQDVTPIDTDAVWDRLEADESVGSDAGTTARAERVVEKDAYCERCPFFSAPPDVHCTHEGTSILELVDVDNFRVADCPKVAETERLEEL